MLLVDLRAGFTMLVDSDVGFLLLKDAMVLAVQQGPRMTLRGANVYISATIER